ncbi:MAG: tetratricopeptide repeat protein [Nitrospirales bacterium]
MKRSANFCRLAFTTMVIVALILVTPSWLFAHAEIHVRIADLTKKIEVEPENPDLYVKRGELHRVHRDWDAALADYRRAGELEPRSASVHFVRGRMLFEAERLDGALSDLNHFLRIEPRYREALVTRARVLVQLGRPLDAADDYTNAIATLTRPTPEYYLERSKALAEAGVEYLESALAGLDEAIDRIGPLVTLQLYAIELELRMEQYGGALKRLDSIARWMPAERQLFGRGEILRRAGRIPEAREAYAEALEHVNAMPPPRGNNRATKDLEAQLRTALEELSEHY